MKKIFISYSHKDEEWKDLLTGHLKVLELERYYSLWDDRKIKMGEDWFPAIEGALEEASAAILLVSKDFLISPFIREKEVPLLLERRQKEGITVIPVILRPCAWSGVKWLSQIQAFPIDGRPLSGFRKNKQETLLAELAKQLADILNAPAHPTVEPSAQPSPKEPPLPPIRQDTHVLTQLPVRNIDLIGRQLAKNHPSLATSFNNVSLIYKELGYLDRALRFSQKAVDILQRLFPNGHPKLTACKRNLEGIKGNEAKGGKKRR